MGESRSLGKTVADLLLLFDVKVNFFEALRNSLLTFVILFITIYFVKQGIRGDL